MSLTVAARRLTPDQPFALSEDHRDRFAHLLQTFEWGWSAAKSYVEGNLALRLDFWARPDDFNGDFKHRIAIFQRAPSLDRHLLAREANVAKFIEDDGKMLRVAMDRAECRYEHPMFVFVGEESESGQGVDRVWAFDSLMWLAELDEPACLRMQPSDVPLPSFAIRVAEVVRGRIIEDRKRVAEARLCSIGDDELPEQMIEDSPQILDVIPGDNAPVQWRLAGDGDAADTERGLLVYLGDDPIGSGFRAEEGPYQGFERVKMEFCPL